VRELLGASRALATTPAPWSPGVPPRDDLAIAVRTWLSDGSARSSRTSTHVGYREWWTASGTPGPRAEQPCRRGRSHVPGVV